MKRPDYARIATLEYEIYGETFRHDGSPPRLQKAWQQAVDHLLGEFERAEAARDGTRMNKIRAEIQRLYEEAE